MPIELSKEARAQAVAEAQERLLARVQELDIELHKDEFGYWQRRKAPPRPRR